MTNIKNEKNKFRTGFTIIELLVVIVIIGILAAISLVSYNGIQAKARDASVMSDLDTMDALQTNYGIKNGLAGKAYYSGSGPDATLGFTPSNGNIIDVVINSSDYCIRGYNAVGTKNTIYNAFIKESSVGVCAQIGASTAALADYYGPPPSPSNLTAINNTSTQITLNWSAPTNNGGSAITNYKVYRGASSGNEVLVATLSNVLTYVNSGLTASTTYYYKVTAVSNLGEGSYSNEISAITPVTTTVAGGNTVTTDGAYTVRTFTSSGTLTVTGGTITGAQVLVVGGGGGGAQGGGGAGGFVYDTAVPLTSGTYPIVIGGGGNGAGSDVGNGANGGNSTGFGKTAIGGGGGGWINGHVGSAGGSGGGGGGGTPVTGGAGTAGQGYAGGNSYPSNNQPSGGGGGAGAAGGTATSTTASGAGGAGASCAISGVATDYAGGGGGGHWTTGTGGAAGTGGGGAGHNQTQGVGVNGTANTGGGGGGNGQATGGAGGSGIVIIRYLTP